KARLSRKKEIAAILHDDTARLRRCDEDVFAVHPARMYDAVRINVQPDAFVKLPPAHSPIRIAAHRSELLSQYGA
ncbi:MAG TPA: hypothetical protein VGM99_06005, partial [Candidatus Cybelea sp.]